MSWPLLLIVGWTGLAAAIVAFVAVRELAFQPSPEAILVAHKAVLVASFDQGRHAGYQCYLNGGECPEQPGYDLVGVDPEWPRHVRQDAVDHDRLLAYLHGMRAGFEQAQEIEGELDDRRWIGDGLDDLEAHANGNGRTA